ncbi:hypothetical protein WMW72_00250 [Paenibacillus filicis]|uniref:Uncharacterized protein n=1 Tax=Paenibacillus filicis TaxID=669464 RepID=A0ABU9DBW2_9BACL
MMNLFELEMQMKEQQETLRKQARGLALSGIPLMDWLLGMTGLFGLVL